VEDGPVVSECGKPNQIRTEQTTLLQAVTFKLLLCKKLMKKNSWKMKLLSLNVEEPTTLLTEQTKLLLQAVMFQPLLCKSSRKMLLSTLNHCTKSVIIEWKMTLV